MKPRISRRKRREIVIELGRFVRPLPQSVKRREKSRSLGGCKQKDGKFHAQVLPGCRVAPDLLQIPGERLAIDANCSNPDPDRLLEGSLSRGSSPALL